MTIVFKTFVLLQCQIKNTVTMLGAIISLVLIWKVYKWLDENL